MFECVIMSYRWIKSHVHARIKHKIIAIESNKCHRTNDELKIIVSLCMPKRCSFFCLSFSIPHPFFFIYFFSVCSLTHFDHGCQRCISNSHVSRRITGKMCSIMYKYDKNIIKRQTSGRWRSHTERTPLNHSVSAHECQKPCTNYTWYIILCNAFHIAYPNFKLCPLSSTAIHLHIYIFKMCVWLQIQQKLRELRESTILWKQKNSFVYFIP